MPEQEYQIPFEQKQILNGQYQEQQLKNQILAKQAYSTVIEDNKDNNHAKWQIDLTNEKMRVQHQLMGYTELIMSDGSTKWMPPKKRADIKLTPYGLQLFLMPLNTLCEKPIILSDFSNAEILAKMHDIGLDFIDAINSNHDRIYNEPSIIDLEEDDIIEIQELINEKKEMEKEMGHDAITDQIRQKRINHILKRIDILRNKTDYDYLKQAQDIFNYNCNMHVFFIEQVLQLVHAAYKRAENGGERKIQRSIITISQNDPLYRSPPPVPQKGGLINRFFGR
jgi:hypothetical protein